MKAVISKALVVVLILQTACYRNAGPPQPPRPDDAAQQSAIEEAREVDVTKINGRTYRLVDPVVQDSAIGGLWNGIRPAQYTTIPMDSISQIQFRKYDWVAVGVLVVTFGAITAIGLAGMLANLSPYPW